MFSKRSAKPEPKGKVEGAGISARAGDVAQQPPANGAMPSSAKSPSASLDREKEQSFATPLFYKDPKPLSAVQHLQCRLKPGDASFAAGTNSVPIVVSEFAQAARSFPIVFAAGSSTALALLGLERANLFVDGGIWADGSYMPAYVRRYPFVFITTPDQEKFALGVDMDSGRVVKNEEGSPLFGEDGQPSESTRRALAFCEAFQGDVFTTRAFSSALREKNLLVDKHTNLTLPNGRRTTLRGFEIVDAARLAELDELTVLEWHRKGWLALVHFHLASLAGFRDLVSRQAARSKAASMRAPIVQGASQLAN